MVVLNCGRSVRRITTLVFIGDLAWQYVWVQHVVLLKSKVDYNAQIAPLYHELEKNLSQDKKGSKPCILNSSRSQHASKVSKKKIFKEWNSE